MTWTFGDSMDFYAAVADALAGYWDSGTSTGYTLQPGRFAGSQALQSASTGSWLTKSSAVNDSVHHFICAVEQTAALSGTTAGLYFELFDATTAQCSVVFRSDGAILLTSGGPTGTTLATYTGAISAQNTWTAFEIEVVVHASAGSITVRKNGNVGAADFTLGSLNTAAGGVHNYANKLTIGQQASIVRQLIDDLLWRSDATSVAWLGDIRAYQQMPASDASVQFAKSPTTVTTTPFSGSSTLSKASGAGLMAAFTAPYTGTIASVTVQVSTGGTGNLKAAIYDAAKANVLATSNAVVNPVAGAVAITFGTPLSVTKGTVYHLAVDADFTIIYTVTSSSSAGFSFTTAYASFPAASPTTAATAAFIFSVVTTPTVNAELVGETLQDGTTSYVFDATVGHGDLYAITPLASTPNSIIGVNTRAFMSKSDAGSRSGQIQIKSGSTTVNSTPLVLSTSFGWNSRFDLLDPNGNVAWTAAAVNALNIGPSVAS